MQALKRAPNELIAHRYQVIKQIGTGGSAAIFLAEDIVLERKVALKRFNTDNSQISRARIQQESVIFAKINHPKIIRLYDVFFEKGNVYLVLEYVDSRDLSKVMTPNGIAIENIVHYCCDILEGLKYLHDQQVVHRDIKPSNILISKSNQAFIADLGIGKHLDDLSQSLTVTGELVGTPVYMSTEAMEGETTFASDVYSLGAVIFEMLTGRPPFIGKNVVELVNKAQKESPPQIDSLRTGIPAEIQDIVSRMLSKNPADRPTVAEALQVFKTIDISDFPPLEVAHNLGDATLRRPEQPEPSASAIEAPPAPTLQGSQAADDQFSEIFQTVIVDKNVSPSQGFFPNEEARLEEFQESIEFYRDHLDKDYQTLLQQARVSFVFWILCTGLAFALIGVGIGLLYFDAIAAGSVTIASNAFILFIQNTFKNREEYYREQASKKSRHLEIGNIWNLAAQSVDGIGDEQARKDLLERIIDALISRLQIDPKNEA